MLFRSGHPWITPRRGRTCYEMADRACGLAGFRPRVVAESNDFTVQLELVASGIGVALVPDLTVATVPPGVLLATPAVPVRRHIYAARRTVRRGDPGLDRLTAELRAAAEICVRPHGARPA